MLTLIITAIVNLLVFFFERWWTANHPVDPAPQKAAFVKTVGGLRYFYLGPNRAKYAGKLFDKFVTNYRANPPLVYLSTAPLSSDVARAIASSYASGLTLSSDEAKA